MSFLLLLQGDRTPRLLHWGKALDDADLPALAATSLPAVMNSSFDEPRAFPLLPTERDGWSGTPALAWHRAGRHSAPDLRLSDVEHSERRAVLRFADERAGVEATVEYAIDEHGVVAASAAVANVSDDPAPLDLLAARLLMPLPARTEEILDFTGRWTSERRPQRTPITDGTHARYQRRGRTGHDSPFVSLAGTAGFGFRGGEVWAAHVAWSGNQEYLVERLPEGAGAHSAALGGGELLQPGEVRLAPGERYCSPPVLFTWGEAGIDSVSARLHGRARSLAAYPRTPRPLVLNTWEAVYFDHDAAKLAHLAEVAAEIGVERFVLDDGWFHGRSGDTAALGDWTADGAKWPDGLGPLAERVHALGMQFGLWFEPEMVNRDSDLAREHPEWILGERDGGEEWRHQLVLDIADPEVFAHLLDRMDAAIGGFGVDFVKWDHNRDLHGAVARRTGRASVRDQTLAAYALMDELRRRHPSLEIESCASGGARVDLGVMAHAQRVWASDTNDPVERQAIQRWTGVLLPPEVVGTHVGPAEAHTTHRVTALPFRLATALFGHAGIEWDVTACDPEELLALREWAALYKELRPLLHSGTTVRSDEVDEGALLHGVVSPSRDRAVFAWVRTAPAPHGHTPRTRIPGLDPESSYRVAFPPQFADASRHQVADPEWIGRESVFSGRFLGDVGLPLPLLNPGAALVLSFTAA